MAPYDDLPVWSIPVSHIESVRCIVDTSFRAEESTFRDRNTRDRESGSCRIENCEVDKVNRHLEIPKGWRLQRKVDLLG